MLIFKKKDMGNQGFSLIEVMLAMTILLLIAIPFMGYFMTSTKENVISSDMQGATIAAQGVMEEIKVKTVKEIWDAKDDTGAAIFHQVDEYGVSLGSSFVKQTTEPYYFLKKNIDYQGFQYDAFITLDYGASEVNAANNADIPKLQEVSGKNRVLIYQDAQDDSAASYFVGLQLEEYNKEMASPSPGASPIPADVPQSDAVIKGKIKKDISITLEEAPLDSSKVQIKAEYVYSPIAAGSVWGCDLGDTYSLAVNSDVVIMDRPDPGSNIAVYFFYKPLPGTMGEEAPYFVAAESLDVKIGWKDSLINPYTLDFYLVCQEDTVTGDLEPYSGYYMKVPQFIHDLNPSTVTFHSNVNTQKALKSDFITSEKKQRLFKTNIKIYKSGSAYDAANVLTSYDSTKGVWNYED